MAEHGILVRSAGGRIFREARGAGAPIVFVHGFSFDARMWEQQFAAFAVTHHAVRYDLRGFGRSDLPAGPYSHVEDLQALINALGLEKPLLVGLSLGGNILLEHALRYPGVARGQVLISAGLPGHAWTTERPPDAIQRLARERGVKAAREAWLAHPIYGSISKRSPEGHARLRAMIEDYHGWHWTGDDPRSAPGDIAGRLAGVDLPTLVLSGGTDAEGYRAIAERLGAEIPHARLVVFEQAGHVLPLEEPDRTSNEIRRFDKSLAI